jgi:serine protease Do
MSDGLPTPPAKSEYPPSSPPPFGSDVRDEPQRGGVRLGWAIWALLFLLLMLVVPTFVEQIQYAATRGKERAEAEIARQLLDEGKGPTIGQYRIVVKAVKSSVVGVKASRRVGGGNNDEMNFLFRQGGMIAQDQGSGVIIDTEGFIITNYHVVDQASEVSVELSDGSKHVAQVIGIDPATDLAVLKISAANLTAAPWGKSADLEVGDPVLAIGNPFGLDHTVTAGILSATGRHAKVERVSYQNFLQTDAAVNPGNSGGPLVNMRGEIIGINTAIVGPTYQGVSFAIPSDMVREVYNQLVKNGKVARGWLGVEMRELTPEQAEKLGVHGALVMGVRRDSPAAAAGIEPGDVIVKWNGKPVNSPSDLGYQVAWSKIGDKVSVTVQRDEETKELKVTVGQWPASLERQR